MKKKLSKIGKNVLLPSAAFVFLFLGAGSPVTVATAPTHTATSSEVAPAPAAPGVSLEEFCQEHWGDLIEQGRYCRFEQWFHLNLKHAGAKPVLTAFELLPGDTLRVDSQRFPEALVGGTAYDASEEKVLVRSAGYLAFRPARGQLFYSVERLGIERCFESRGGAIDTTACPE